MGKKKPTKRLSGAGQIKASGKVAVLVALTPEAKRAIQDAANGEQRSMAAFIAYHAERAAKKWKQDNEQA